MKRSGKLVWSLLETKLGPHELRLSGMVYFDRRRGKVKFEACRGRLCSVSVCCLLPHCNWLVDRTVQFDAVADHVAEVIRLHGEERRFCLAKQFWFSLRMRLNDR